MYGTGNKEKKRAARCLVVLRLDEESARQKSLLRTVIKTFELKYCVQKEIIAGASSAWRSLYGEALGSSALDSLGNHPLRRFRTS